MVPPGAREGWAHDPFSGLIEHGRLYGRGAADMKSGVGAFAAAAAQLVAEGWPAQGRVTLLITGDEEKDAVNGTAKLLAWALAQGERFDACLVGEPTSPLWPRPCSPIWRRTWTRSCSFRRTSA